MTATVIQGVQRGTGTKLSHVIYDNTTGGNVRLIIYFIKFESKSMGASKLFMGPTAPNDDNAGHSQGNHPNTIEFDTGQTMYAGHNMAIYLHSDYTIHNAAGSSGHMATEMMLANGYKLFVYSNEHYLTDDVVCQYNMVAIPE